MSRVHQEYIDGGQNTSYWGNRKEQLTLTVRGLDSSSGRVVAYRTSGLYPRMGQGRLSCLPFSSSIITKLAWGMGLALVFSLQTDHLIGTSDRVLHHPMTTHTEIGNVGLSSHGLLCH
ncbi:hypothetical protein TNCV_3900561 [Trichonephila clavipes]|nr:hypothetical protein TNCV_3900561 [Trichonephila clavipes]